MREAHIQPAHSGRPHTSIPPLSRPLLLLLGALLLVLLCVPSLAASSFPSQSEVRAFLQSEEYQTTWQQAQDAEKNGMWEEALSLYSSLLPRLPHHSSLHGRLAACHMALGLPDSGFVRHLEIAVRHHHKDRSWTELILACNELVGHYSKVKGQEDWGKVTHYLTLLSKLPGNHQLIAQKNLARILLHTQQLESALTAFNKLETLLPVPTPNNEEEVTRDEDWRNFIHWNRANILYALYQTRDRDEEAIEEVRKALKIRPNEVESQHLLVKLLLRHRVSPSHSHPQHAWSFAEEEVRMELGKLFRLDPTLRQQHESRAWVKHLEFESVEGEKEGENAWTPVDSLPPALDFLAAATPGSILKRSIRLGGSHLRSSLSAAAASPSPSRTVQVFHPPSLALPFFFMPNFLTDQEVDYLVHTQLVHERLSASKPPPLLCFSKGTKISSFLKEGEEGEEGALSTIKLTKQVQPFLADIPAANVHCFNTTKEQHSLSASDSSTSPISTLSNQLYQRLLTPSRSLLVYAGQDEVLDSINERVERITYKVEAPPSSAEKKREKEEEGEGEREAGLLRSHSVYTQLLQYSSGSSYAAHTDWYEGGETFFPRIGVHGIKVRPTKGMAVWFRSLDEEGFCSPYSEHASTPIVKKGDGDEQTTQGTLPTKFVLQKWFHRFPITAPADYSEEEKLEWTPSAEDEPLYDTLEEMELDRWVTCSSSGSCREYALTQDKETTLQQAADTTQSSSSPSPSLPSHDDL